MYCKCVGTHSLTGLAGSKCVPGIGNEYSTRECYHTETRLTVCVLELLGPLVVSVLCHLLCHSLVEEGEGGEGEGREGEGEGREGLKEVQGLDTLVTHPQLHRHFYFGEVDHLGLIGALNLSSQGLSPTLLWADTSHLRLGGQGVQLHRSHLAEGPASR